MWYINSSGRIHGSDLTVCKFLQTNPLTGSQLRQVMEWKLNRVQIRAIHYKTTNNNILTAFFARNCHVSVFLTCTKYSTLQRHILQLQNNHKISNIHNTVLEACYGTLYERNFHKIFPQVGDMFHYIK